jgi:hypothetical protein
LFGQGGRFGELSLLNSESVAISAAGESVMVSLERILGSNCVLQHGFWLTVPPLSAEALRHVRARGIDNPGHWPRVVIATAAEEIYEYRALGQIRRIRSSES